MKRPPSLIGFVTACFLSANATGAVSSLLTIDDGDARVRQWNTSTGGFVGDPALLMLNGEAFDSNSDIEWDGEFYYSIAAGDARVRRFDSSGEFKDDVALLTDESGPVPLQVGLAFDGAYFYTIALNDERIRRYSLSGEFLGDFANLSNSLGSYTSATGIAKDESYFYTVESGSAIVRRFNLAGEYVDDFLMLNDDGVPFERNTGIAIIPIPEPASAALLLLGTAAAFLRRRGMIMCRPERHCGTR